jgi:hypothetical protein
LRAECMLLVANKCRGFCLFSCGFVYIYVLMLVCSGEIQLLTKFCGRFRVKSCLKNPKAQVPIAMLPAMLPPMLPKRSRSGTRSRLHLVP